MGHGPKMDWTLDNGLYQRFKVFKERCTDILSGPPHVIQRKIRSTILDIGQERKVPNLFPNVLQKERSQMMKKRQLPKKKLKAYWKLFEDYAKPKSNSLIADVEL